ncbi:MAG: hypothetical protein CMJ46_11790 [Planctomyces sp.]|nr:hypothetical protein [Planctomyces sp.]
MKFWFSLFLTVLLSGQTALHAQDGNYNGPPIDYATAEVNDPVTKLGKQIEAGTAQLSFDENLGYLPAVLEALEVPESSQVLVFSKTSLQVSRISPRRPRAIYFNDDVYVGYCQFGDVLEIAATDAKQGAIFYTLDQSNESAPKFLRDKGHCLGCHSSSRTQDVPGYLVRSVFPQSSGMPEFGRGTYTSDHTSPFEDRWGGWYVTGTHGEMRHMGNAVLKDRDGELDRETNANRTSLEGLFPTAPYPTPHSDIVALMVLEHQTQMHNALAAANYETRRAIHQSRIINEILEKDNDELSESSDRRINWAAERVVKHLLMCDEFALTSPVTGTSSFTDDFQARGMRDSEGRSLRDFDLQTRLFRYPCSYLIYADAFEGLPDEVRRRVMLKLDEILLGKLDEEESDDFDHLSPDDRRNIREILLETKPEFKSLVEADK